MVIHRPVHATRLFRGNIFQRTFQFIRVEELLGFEIYFGGDAEINDVHTITGCIDQDIFTVDILVDDVLIMDFMQHLQNLVGQLQKLKYGDLFLLYQFFKAFPFDIFQYQRRFTIHLLDGERFTNPVDPQVPGDFEFIVQPLTFHRVQNKVPHHLKYKPARIFFMFSCIIDCIAALKKKFQVFHLSILRLINFTDPCDDDPALSGIRRLCFHGSYLCRSGPGKYQVDVNDIENGKDKTECHQCVVGK